MRIAYAAGTLAVHTHYDLFVTGRKSKIMLDNAPVEAMADFTYDLFAMSPSGARIVAVRFREQSMIDLIAGTRALPRHPTLESRYDITFVDESTVLAVANPRGYRAGDTWEVQQHLLVTP